MIALLNLIIQTFYSHYFQFITYSNIVQNLTGLWSRQVCQNHNQLLTRILFRGQRTHPKLFSYIFPVDIEYRTVIKLQEV